MANIRGLEITAPVLDTDPVPKSELEAAQAGFDLKEPVRVATTSTDGNQSLSGAVASIDGVTLTNGDRILVKNQTTASENGLYTYNDAGAWLRTTDADGTPSNEVSQGLLVLVLEGTENLNTQWSLTTPDPITVGSTNLTFTKLSGGLSGTLSISQGGTGQTTQQAAIDTLTDVASASTGQVLTKDGSGNATFQDVEGTILPQASLQTTDGSAQTLYSLTMPDDSNIAISVVVSAYGPAGKHYWAHIVGSARKEGINAPVLVGTPFVAEDSEGTPGYTVSFDINGNDLRVRVTGAAAETVQWEGRISRTSGLELVPPGSITSVISNDTYIQWRNNAGTANLDVIKVDANDDTILQTGNYSAGVSGAQMQFFSSGGVELLCNANANFLSSNNFAIYAGSSTAATNNKLIINSTPGTEYSELGSDGTVRFYANYSAGVSGAQMVMDGSAGGIDFYTGGTLRWTLDSTGKLLPYGNSIGTVAPYSSEPNLAEFICAKGGYFLGTLSDRGFVAVGDTASYGTSPTFSSVVMEKYGPDAVGNYDLVPIPKAGLGIINAINCPQGLLVAATNGLNTIRFATATTVRWSILPTGTLSNSETSSTGITLDIGGADATRLGSIANPFAYMGLNTAGNPTFRGIVFGNINGNTPIISSSNDGFGNAGPLWLQTANGASRLELSSGINFYTSGALRWIVQSDGALTCEKSGITPIAWRQSGVVARILGPSDNTGRLQITPAGDPNTTDGPYIDMDAASGGFALLAKNGGDIGYYTNGVLRWIMDSNGYLRPGANNLYYIANSPSQQCLGVYSQDFIRNGFVLNSNFSGVHTYESADNTLTEGDAVCFDANMKLVKCTTANSPTCIGIFTTENVDIDAIRAAEEAEPGSEFKVEDSLGNIHTTGTLHRVASVGDTITTGLSGAKVCDEGGPVSAGDFLTTATKPGFLKKQTTDGTTYDNTLRDYTVAQAMQDVTFDGNGEATGVYCFLKK